VLSRLLRPIQRAFLLVNGALVGPALRAGMGIAIGTPAFGHLMLLRTTGRRTGRRRDVPLGYVIREGAIWCVAGYGAATPWYRNLLDDPRVEVILPGRRVHGLAMPATDDREWLAAYRALIASFGVTGRLVVGEIARLSDAELLARHRSLPVVRIAPHGLDRPIEPGPFDEGWAGAVLGTGLVILAVVAIRVARSARRDLLAGQLGVGPVAMVVLGRAVGADLQAQFVPAGDVAGDRLGR
jgi:deazaflavin-dependent oxidoreductase (nitroreductase family)